MPDLDSLSIRINSSSTEAVHKIEDVIRALGNLNAALNNYADGSPYIRGMNNLAGGLRGVASAVNSIDLNKINSVKTALGSLAGAGERLTKLNFVSTFSQMGNETQKINSAAANTTKSLMDMFNVPRSYKGELTEAVKTLYQSGNSPTAFSKASKDITDLIRKAQTAKKEYSDVYRYVRQFLNADGFKLYIPKEVMDVWDGDAKSKLATIGVGNWTSDLSKATVFLDELPGELQEVYRSSDQAAHGMTGIANALVDFLEEEKNLATVHTDLETLGAVLDELQTKILGTSESFTTLAHTAKVGEDGFMVADDLFDPFDMETDAQRATNAIHNVTAAVTDLESKANIEIANPFEGLIRGLESLKGVEIPAEKFAGVATLASSLGKFGSKNATNAITIIPQIGRSFAQMAAELAKAPAISNNLVRLAEALSQYSRSAQTASKSTNAFGLSTNILKTGLSGLYAPTMRSRAGFMSLAAVIGHLYANFFLLIRGARLLGKAMDYSSSMTEAQNVVSVVFGKSSEVMDKFAKTAIKDFGLARLSAVEFASRFQAMGKTMGITSEQVVKANEFIAGKISGNVRAYKDLGDSVADVSINLTKLTADIASLYNQDYEDVAKDMQSIYTGMTRPLRKYGLDLTNATLKEWAMSQGLESNIEKMTQAEKTMLRYQYVMSRTAGAMGDFQKTQDTWANSLRTIKQLMQEIARTIGEALINALRPALLAFKNFLFSFIELAEKGLNALGKLLGWHQIDFGGASLVEDTEDYADALDDAAGAAKKLKNQLRGIDELNNLTTNKGNGGGAGDIAGLGAGIESLWDQIVDTDRVYESNVKNWKDFGQRIAKSMKDGLDQVDWDSIYSKSSTFGTNFANFLNGLIDPELWHTFGTTLAGGLMTAIEFAFAFGKDFDFENLGEAIAEGINGFFEEFDGGKLADVFNTWVDGFETTLKKAAEKIKWDEVFADLFGFFENIELDTIGFALAAGATILGVPAIAKALGVAIAQHPITLGTITIAAIGGFKFGNWIGEQWEEALGTNPETGESYWQEYWEKIFKSYEDTFNWYVENEGRSLIWTAISKFFTKDGLKVIGHWNKDVFDKTLGGEWNPFRKMWDNILTDPLNEWFDEHGIETQSDLKEYGSLLWKSFWGIEDKDEEQGPKSWFKLFQDELAKSENTATGEDYYDFYFGWLDRVDWVGLEAKLGVLVGSLSDLVKPGNSDGINTLGTAFITLGEDIGITSEDIENLKKKFAEFKEDALLRFTEFKEGIGLKLGEIKENFNSWIENDVKPFFDKDTWLGYLDGVRQAFEEIWNDPLAFAKNFFNKVSEWAEPFINGIIDGFGKLFSGKNLLTGATGNYNITHITLPKFAAGGYPTTGSLFWAGEQGAELVGSINGNTAVASNGEITGITQAIRSSSDTEIALLRQQNELLTAILNKEFGISEDALFSSVRRSALDFTRSTGSPAFD